jgi:hypothetical protein
MFKAPMFQNGIGNELNDETTQSSRTQTPETVRRPQSSARSVRSARARTATKHRDEESYDDEYENGNDLAPHVMDDDLDEQRDLMRTAVYPARDLQSSDRDDMDVQVRGEDESEYGDDHKADTADVLDVENLKKHGMSLENIVSNYLISNLSSDVNHGGTMSQESESIIEGIVNADPEVDSLDAEQKETYEVSSRVYHSLSLTQKNAVTL